MGVVLCRDIVLTVFLYLHLSIYHFINPFIHSFIYSSIHHLSINPTYLSISQSYILLLQPTSLQQQQNPLLKNSEFYLNLHPVLIQKPHPQILKNSLGSLVRKDLVLLRLNLKFQQEPYLKGETHISLMPNTIWTDSYTSLL